MLKKIFLITSLLALSIVFVPKPAFAAQASQQGSFMADLNAQTKAAAEVGGAGFESPTDPRLVVSRIIRVFLTTVGVLFFAYMVYGGAIIFLSGGSEDKISEGKNVLKRSVVGLIVVLSAYSITVLVTKVVQGDGGPCADGNCTIIEEGKTKSFIQEDSNPNGHPSYAPWDCNYLENGDCDLENP